MLLGRAIESYEDGMGQVKKTGGPHFRDNTLCFT